MLTQNHPVFTEGGETHSEPRFRRDDNGSEVLAFVAGCCLHTTTPSQAVGYGIKSSNDKINSGYFEQPLPQSKHRAVLHAAIEVLKEVQVWSRVYVHRLVVACSSKYLVNGVYDRVGLGRKWIHLCKTRFRPDPYEELWKTLMHHLEKCNEQGLWVQFWKISERVNEASSAAQSSALSSMADMNHVPLRIAEVADEIDKL
jgi:ribonuclease HI